MEMVRRLVRALLGPNSYLYRRGAYAYSFCCIAAKEGPKMAVILDKMQRAECGSSEVALQLRSLKSEIWVRPGTKDVDAVINNIIRCEYGKFQEHFPGGSAVLVDCGAYIGDTASFFLSKYPSLAVVAFEPNQTSAALAKKNIALYQPRVRLEEAAVGVFDGEAALSGEQTSSRVGGEVGRRVRVIAFGPLINQLAKEYKGLAVKMDIEGAEEALFSDGVSDWLSKCHFVVVEAHSDYGVQKIVLQLNHFAFTVKRYRSLIYGWKSPR